MADYPEQPPGTVPVWHHRYGMQTDLVDHNVDPGDDSVWVFLE